MHTAMSHKTTTTQIDLTIAFFVLNIAMLVPSGWVLTNMENYKHRPGSK
uniref:Uncharacterized protein n=1 Tax=Callorhinchus milii TaxID=7868 RepID=A0A4W3GFZ1_CALMI